MINNLGEYLEAHSIAKELTAEMLEWSKKYELAYKFVVKDEYGSIATSILGL